MYKGKNLTTLIELAIELAWQTKQNPKKPRAEQRHELVRNLKKINLKKVPKDDIDEFIKKYKIDEFVKSL